MRNLVVNFSDPTFIASIINLEPGALTKLIEAYTSHLVKAGLGVGLSEEMAHDLAANTWTTFLEVVPRFEGRSHIRTFVFGIFYNKLSELRRANFKFQKTDPIEEAMESQFLDDGHWSVSFSDPEKLAGDKELSRLVEECLDGMPLLQKTAFLMRVVEEEESETVCEALQISDVNLRQLVFRAKNKIRDCVERNLK